MANYKVSDTDLTSVANAIRTKGGTSAPLAFPSGFINAIGNISGGGSSNVVTGTFTGVTTGAAMDVSIPYIGSGYPIAGFIFPKEGAFKNGSTIAELIQNYAIYLWSFAKDDISATPTYDSNAEANLADGTVLVKYGTSSTGVTDSRFHANQTYNTTIAGATSGSCVRFKSSTTMSVYIASTSYGFKDGVEYTYWLIYSS